MRTITTKQIAEKGLWYCSTTHDCYDHLESGITIEEAQHGMTTLLRKLGYKGELKFEEPKPYVKRLSVAKDYNYPTYMTHRIDKGMV